MAPSIGNVFDEVNKYRPPYNSSAFPVYNTTTPGGGSISSGINKSVNFSGIKPLMQGFKSGKTGKNLKANNPTLFNDILAGKNVDFNSLPAFWKNKYKQSGGKVQKTPFFNVTPDTDAQSAFDTLQDDYLKQLEDQKVINKQITGALLPSLLGFQNKSIGAASDLAEGGFTDLNPFAQEQITKAQKAFEDEGMIDLNRQLEGDAENVKAILADSGIPLGRSSDGDLYLERAALRPFADARARLKAQSQQFGHTLAQDWLGNRRNAYSTYLQSPAMNNAISGLNTPSLPVNPFLMSPTGLYTPDFIQQGNQFNTNFGLNRDQMVQGNFNSMIGPAITAASQPGVGSAIGNIAGNIAGTTLPLAFFAQLMNKRGGKTT